MPQESLANVFTYYTLFNSLTARVPSGFKCLTGKKAFEKLAKFRLKGTCSPSVKEFIYQHLMQKKSIKINATKWSYAA